MWKEWLARTLSPRRAEAAGPPAPGRRSRHGGPPDLEGDGMHPGADEFRAALDRIEAEIE